MLCIFAARLLDPASVKGKNIRKCNVAQIFECLLFFDAVFHTIDSRIVQNEIEIKIGKM